MPNKAWSFWGIDIQSIQQLARATFHSIGTMYSIRLLIAEERSVLDRSGSSEAAYVQLVVATSPDSATVALSLTQPASRVVVDHYQRGKKGAFSLVFDSQDLLRYLAFTAKARVSLSELPLDLTPPPAARQSTDKLLMVAPTAFGFNEQAARDNHFMHRDTHAGEGDEEGSIVGKVAKEFAGLHHQLEEVHGVPFHFESPDSDSGNSTLTVLLFDTLFGIDLFIITIL
jgi:hypothetical protein